MTDVDAMRADRGSKLRRFETLFLDHADAVLAYQPSTSTSRVRWPAKSDRDARLLECVDVMRALLRGEEVSHDGLISVHRARLWSLPEAPPQLFGAAVSEATARTVGAWADGMITVNQPEPVLQRVIDAFREGGGEGKPVHVRPPLVGRRRGGRGGDRARAMEDERVRGGTYVGARKAEQFDG